MLPFRVNRRRCPFPTTPSSQRHLCAIRVSALSFPNHFLSPLNLERSTINLRPYLDAASSISPLFATLTENTRGGGIPTFPDLEEKMTTLKNTKPQSVEIDSISDAMRCHYRRPSGRRCKLAVTAPGAPFCFTHTQEFNKADSQPQS